MVIGESLVDGSRQQRGGTTGEKSSCRVIYLVTHFPCPRATAVNVNGGVVGLEGGEGEAAIILPNVAAEMAGLGGLFLKKRANGSRWWW